MTSRKDFLFNEMQEAQSFDLSKEEISLYFERIEQFIIENSSDAFRRMMSGFPAPEEPLSERQAICSQKAIQCLLKQDCVQALHETLDVLHDYNKATPLNYNECVVLQNILTVYGYLK